MDIPKTSNGPAVPDAAAPDANATPEPLLPVWMQRTFLIIYVLFCLEVGLMLAIVAWTDVWTRNVRILPFEWMRLAAQTGFVRGVVSGVGLVDIWFGIWEAVQYRDQRPVPNAQPSTDRTTAG